MESHWENSSSNSIIKDMIEGATEVTKAEIETLISGGCVEKPIIPELTYTDLDSEDRAIRETYLWSVLYAAGYLTDLEQPNGLYGSINIAEINKGVITPENADYLRRKYGIYNVSDKKQM